MTRWVVSLLVLNTARAFVASPQLVDSRAVRVVPTTARQGFLEDMMDKLEGKGDGGKDEWKEQMYREQQEILARRRKTGGFIDEAMEREIKQRRENVAKESAELRKIQQKAGSKDVLDDWKKARDQGKFRTASKGLQRDQQSSRLGSAGLFAERADERLPYIDRGYVANKKGAKNPPAKKPPQEDFFDNLKKNLFGNQ